MGFYQKHIFVCENKRPPGERVSCGNQGSEELLKLLKQKAAKAGIKEKIRVQRAGCLDRCELGPVQVAYPEGIWFRMKTEEDVNSILEYYLKSNEREKIEHLIVGDDETAPD
ncbi:(2Fe-2S) ferredoxin domain-containing protein [Leptospira sp. 96542]|nr:(2Fe-2S) ferredoxin domain-containing protein [Leptospira sp. 96542]